MIILWMLFPNWMLVRAVRAQMRAGLPVSHGLEAIVRYVEAEDACKQAIDELLARGGLLRLRGWLLYLRWKWELL